MGQRHQLFVVAKISGRYRSLAAVHHQWLYSIGAVDSCSRLVKIFSAKENRKLLDLELSHAASLPANTWEEAVSFSNLIPEFPFITTCLMVGAAADFDSHISSVLVETWRLGFNQGDNNDGITILDITDPEAVKYCFVHWKIGGYNFEPDPDDEAAAALAKLSMMPLTANEYLRIYEHLGSDLLETNTLIRAEALMEIWPEGRWVLRQDQDGSTDISTASKESTKKPSLAEMAMRTTIEQMLMHKDKMSDEANELPMFPSNVLKYLQANPEVVVDKPFGYDLLQQVLTGSTVLDLHYFPNLSAEQVLQIVSQAASDIAVLDISGNRNISASHLSQIPKDRCIEELYIWDNPLCPLADLSVATTSILVKKLVHRERFLDIFIGLNERTPNMDTATDTATDLPQSPNIASHLNCSQLILVKIEEKLRQDLSSPEPTNRSFKSLPAQPRNISWQFLPSDDIRLPAGIYLSMMARALNVVAKMRLDHHPANIFGFAAACPDLTRPHNIHPLPRKTYQSPGPYASEHIIMRVPPNIAEPNKYSPFILSEYKEYLDFGQLVRLHIAFLTHDQRGQLRVVDVETLMGEFGVGQKERRIWEDATAKLQGGRRYTGGIDGHFLEGERIEVVAADEGLVKGVLRFMEEYRSADSQEV